MSVKPKLRDGSLNNRVKGREEFPPYEPTRLCPACCYDDVKTIYRAAGCEDDNCFTCPRAHLLRVCQRCHVQWPEAVGSGQQDTTEAHEPTPRRHIVKPYYEAKADQLDGAAPPPAMCECVEGWCDGEFRGPTCKRNQEHQAGAAPPEPERRFDRRFVNVSVPASGTPTEVERLRALLIECRTFVNSRLRDNIDAALSGQQDTERTER